MFLKPGPVKNIMIIKDKETMNLNIYYYFYEFI